MSFSVTLWLMLVAAGLGPERAVQGDDWMGEITDIKDKEIDKDWREYVDKLGGEYEEIPKETTTQHEDDPKYLKEFLDWNPTSPREVPFLAILWVKDLGPSNQYKNYFGGEPDPGISHIEPHKACGGALLSPSHVLTVCGCLSYLITEEVLTDLPTLFKFWDTTPRFRLMSQIGGTRGQKPPLVFVSFSLLRFLPEETYEIDTDKAKWPKNNDINCGLIISTEAGTPDPYIKSARADGTLIVVPFKPKSEVISIYPKWPPALPINRNTDPFYKAYARIASIGMRLTEKTKIRFYSSIAVSSLDMKHCNETSNVCDKRIFPSASRSPYVELDKTHVCFCSVTPNQNPQIVGGVIGWPVVDEEGELIGLTASDRRSADGTIVVAMITELLRREIENYIGKKVLEDQNIPSAVYRERELKDKYLIYDYWAAQYRTPRPKSGAINLVINLWYLFLGFLALSCFM